MAKVDEDSFKLDSVDEDEALDLGDSKISSEGTLEGNAAIGWGDLGSSSGWTKPSSLGLFILSSFGLSLSKHALTLPLSSWSSPEVSFFFRLSRLLLLLEGTDEGDEEDDEGTDFRALPGDGGSRRRLEK